MRDFAAGIITISTSGMTAAEERAALTAQFSAEVADAIMKRHELRDNIAAQGMDHAHHLIPVSVLKATHFLQELVKSGWDCPILCVSGRDGHG